MEKNERKREFVEGGFYLSPRKKFDSDLWKDIRKERLFDYLVGKANHSDKPQYIGRIAVNKGQYLRSYSKIVEDCCPYKDGRRLITWSKSTVKKLVDDLRAEGRISTEETEFGTLFTVCNYVKYQTVGNYSYESSQRHQNAPETLLNDNKNSEKTDNSDGNYIYKGKFLKVTNEERERWNASFPGISIHQELTRMEAYLEDHPEKRRASYKQFIVNWLQREYEKRRKKRDAEPSKVQHTVEQQRSNEMKFVPELIKGILGKDVSDDGKCT